MDKELGIPFVPLDGRDHVRNDLPRCLVLDERANVRENGVAILRILTPPITWQAILSDLKLRFNESHDLAVGRDNVDKRREDQLQRDERDVYNHEIDRFADILRLKVTGVDPFTGDDARIATFVDNAEAIKKSLEIDHPRSKITGYSANFILT